MGVVYKAEDLKLKRNVALKFLLPRPTGNEILLRRFLHEAQAASALDHPNICTIYAVGQFDDQPYIVMAYCRGQTLQDRINLAPLPIHQALDITGQLASGLAAAHERGIIHRDMKPANVILTDKGEVKILDFGLAKIVDVHLTQSGITMGTLPYMAPEQVQGLPISQQADLWALGVILYEMLTGRRPFTGDNAYALSYAILNVNPDPITEHRRDLPPGLSRLVQKALVKDHTERYQSAAQFMGELHHVQQQMEAEGTADSVEPNLSELVRATGFYRRKSYRLGLAAGIVLVLFTLYFSIYGSRSGSQPLRASAFVSPNAGTQTEQALTAENQESGPRVDSVKIDDVETSVRPEQSQSENKVDPLSDPALIETEEALVRAISHGLRVMAGTVHTLYVAPFTYEDSQMGGAFSWRFRRMLEQEFKQMENWQVVSLNGTEETVPTHSLRDLAGNASADYWLTGTYWHREEGMAVVAELRRVSDGSVAARHTALVSDALRRRYESELKPSNFDNVLKDQRTFRKDEVQDRELRLQVWTDRGTDNLLYGHGEQVRIYALVNRPAYLNLIYHLADGTRTLLLENHRLDSENVNRPYRIPEHFWVDAPYGGEVLQVIARTTPFEPTETREVNGYRVLVQDLPTFLATTRGLKKRRNDEGLQAEKRLIITTVPLPPTL